MDRKTLAILAGPVIYGIYFLLDRKPYAAVGAFVATILGIPFLKWYRGLEPSPTLYLTSTGIIIGVTAFAFGYWRWKESKIKR